MHADHQAFWNIRTIWKSKKNWEEIQNKNYVPNTFLLKIWDNIRDTQLFWKNNATHWLGNFMETKASITPKNLLCRTLLWVMTGEQLSKNF